MGTAAAAGSICCAPLLVLALSACAGQSIREGPPLSVMGRVIAPHESHEECVKLVPGDRIDYTFRASAAVAFNIHYHEGKVVVMPITRDDVTADAGIFMPRYAQEYCLMWEAGPDGTFIDYRVTLTRGSREVRR